ncbi:MAG: DUF3226 domain-containing protein [Dehalococcoidia bacterium]
MARESSRIEKPHLLLVEGPEEARFWAAFFEYGLHRDDIELHHTGGKTGLRNAIEALVRTSGFNQVRWFGIAQDADDNPAGTFQSMRDALDKNSLPTPTQAWESAVGARITVTTFVWPSRGRRGDLETMIWDQLSPQAATPCVEAYFDCLAKVAAGPRSSWQAKGKVRAFLASLDRHSVGLADVVRAGLVPLGGGQFQRLTDLLPPA